MFITENIGKTDYQKEENKITRIGTTQIEVNHFEYCGIIFPLKSNLDFAFLSTLTWS